MNIETLIAEREIYRALAAFAYAMDHRDWHSLENIVRADVSDMHKGTGEKSE